MEPEAHKDGGVKEVSKRAAEKAAKKLEKAKKKAEYALRPKEEKAAAAAIPSTKEADKLVGSVFDGGWLKRVYEEKAIQVRTRFPPEPNGFLHIGHSKAIFVNFKFAEHYNGVCFLRFDDTNPEKEEAIYFTAIEEMVAWLGFKPHKITYSSDYFDKLYELAEELIRRDKAYVCYCTKEEVNKQRGGPDNRGTRFACQHRSRPTEESLQEFRAMRDGKYKRGEATLRMKQKLVVDGKDREKTQEEITEEGNPQMWDLAAYRVLNKEHPRTGDKWRIYPTYDYTHCLVDAFEDISHSLCTTEFRLSRISYDWLLEQLDYKLSRSESKGPMQREYGRLSLEGTILSKRRIAALVEGATFSITKPDGTSDSITVPPAVRGWDDPRLFTLVAIRRRGVPAKAILQFVSELGVTDANTVIQTDKFDYIVRKYLERSVPRLHLVLDPIKVIIEDLEDDFIEDISIPYDPKDPKGKSRMVPLSKVIYIDREDFRQEADDDFFRLAPGKVVGLLNVPFRIIAKSFELGSDGQVQQITAVKVEDQKPKAYIHWVGTNNVNVTARQYNALFIPKDPNELDWKYGGYAKELNPHSEVSYPQALAEPSLLGLLKDHKPADGASDDLCRFQAVRTGYFCVDPELDADKIVLNQIVTLKEDTGKVKEAKK